MMKWGGHMPHMVRGREVEKYVQVMVQKADRVEDLGVFRMIILRCIFNTYDRRAWIWARNFAFQNMQAFSSVAEERLASQEELWSMALVRFCMPQNAGNG
jgi:hypothetical protein